VTARDRLRRRAERLEIVLGGRAPWLVRWLPVVGVALGFAVGALLWVVIGSGVVLVREVLLVIAAGGGLIAGRLERTRIGRMLVTDAPETTDDLPAEFGHLVRRFDHRADAQARRDRF
jgi:hypothetical protein